jgi:hypothetical protein
MDFDPIKQLQNLLDDRSKVLERISNIQSALGSITTGESSTPLPSTSPPAMPQPKSVEGAQPDELVYGRLFQALREMQAQIEDRVRPLAREIVNAEVLRIREQTEQNQAALNRCLAQIDQCIVTCVERLDEYQKRHTKLITLNDRLVSLGATAEPLSPDGLALNINEAIQSRIAALRDRDQL